MMGRGNMNESSASSNPPCSTEIPLNPGSADPASNIEQEFTHQEAETLRKLNAVELKELCYKTCAFFRQHEDPVSRELKQWAVKITNALNHPTSNPSMKQLDHLKNEMQNMIQSALRRQEAYLAYKQLPSHVQPQRQLQSPANVLPSCQNLNGSQMQSMKAYSSANALEQNNVRNFQGYFSPSSELATSITMRSQQQFTKSLEERGNSLKSAHQNSMGSSQLPQNPLQSGSAYNVLSQSHGSHPNLIHPGFNQITTHPIYSNQHNEQLHAAVTNLMGRFQENQPQQQKQRLAAYQIPQGIGYERLHLGMSEVKNLNSRNEISKISGVFHPTPARQHQPLMSGVASYLSSARISQPEWVHVSQRSSQNNHQNLLVKGEVESSNSSSVASSPISTTNPEAQKHSNTSSTLNTGNIRQHITDTSPLTKRCVVVVGTSGTPTSHSVLVQHGNVDKTDFNVSTLRPVESRDADDPIQRLVKALILVSSKAIIDAASDINKIVSQSDCIAMTVPKCPVDEDLRTISGVHPEARHFSGNCRELETRNLKRYIIPSPTKRRLSTDMEISEEMMTTTLFKRARIEVKDLLLKETEEINRQLIDTVVSINDDHINSTARGTGDCGDIIVKCSFSAVTVTPRFNLLEASSGISPIEPLQLLVPADYPSCSPTILTGQFSEKHGNISGKVMAVLQKYLRILPQPISVGELARAWDASVRAVILEYAKQNGGGTFSSKYGAWEGIASKESSK